MRIREDIYRMNSIGLLDTLGRDARLALGPGPLRMSPSQYFTYRDGSPNGRSRRYSLASSIYGKT